MAGSQECMLAFRLQVMAERARQMLIMIGSNMPQMSQRLTQVFPVFSIKYLEKIIIRFNRRSPAYFIIRADNRAMGGTS